MATSLAEYNQCNPTAPIANRDDSEVDPEVIALAEEFCRDPYLFGRRNEFVQSLGVIGEGKNIALYFTVLTSCKIIGLNGESHALAMKNSGNMGGGKSHALSKCLLLIPKTDYVLMTAASQKAFFNFGENDLRHKALIMAEGLQLEASNGKDTDLIYAVRSLLSEGEINYSFTSINSQGKKGTVTIRIKGPTAVLTTTIQWRLEAQLEDRMITIRPNTSTEQTAHILDMSAKRASGEVGIVDDKIIKAWQHFHKSLEPAEVVIPYAKMISDYVSRSGDLPITARRSFNRFLAIVATICITYQYQRRSDENNRLVAEWSDYSIAYQLGAGIFLDSIGVKTLNDTRMELIADRGPIQMKEVAKLENVTVPRISQWAESRIEKGYLTWCDINGDIFPDQQALRSAKSAGKAYLKFLHSPGLPSPYQLTGDPEWKVGGRLYDQYDLHLDPVIVEPEDCDEPQAPIKDCVLDTLGDIEPEVKVQSEPVIAPKVSSGLLKFDDVEPLAVKPEAAGVNRPIIDPDYIKVFKYEPPPPVPKDDDSEDQDDDLYNEFSNILKR